MHRSNCAIIVLAALALASFGLASPAAEAGRFSFRLYGAPALFSGGDINEVFQGLCDHTNATAKKSGYTSTGSFGPAHFGLEAGAELIFQITPALGIGLGVGDLSASRENIIEFALGSSKTAVTANPAYGSVPLRLGVFYTLAISSRMNVILSGGPELHFAHALILWKESDNGTDVVREEVNATGTGLGFQAAVGFEFKLSQMFSLLLEISGRYARFGGLTGTLNYSDYGGVGKESGILYRIETPEGFPLFLISETKPDASLHPTEAKLDLTSGSLRFGIVFHI